MEKKMSPEEFCAAQEEMNLPLAGMARIMGVTRRSVARYKSGEREISLQTTKWVRMLLSLHRRNLPLFIELTI